MSEPQGSLLLIGSREGRHCESELFGISEKRRCFRVLVNTRLREVDEKMTSSCVIEVFGCTLCDLTETMVSPLLLYL